MKRALVLAGGGVAGIAWELGVLRGIQDTDPDLLSSILAADTVVGTSAGSAVAAQVTSGADLGDLYEAQLSDSHSEIEVDLNLEELMERFAAATAGAATEQEIRQRIGALALATATVPEVARRTAIAARLPLPDWPERTVLLPAVDAESGELVVFTRDSGATLTDAVSASCAVPGVWPPVTIGGHRYIDGGVRSPTNADLAAGCDRVLIITPTLADSPQPWGSLDGEIDQLKPAGVHVVFADMDSLAAFGPNPLSPATRPPSAHAGREIGQAQAGAISRFWG
jgi:NTE family protein